MFLLIRVRALHGNYINHSLAKSLSSLDVIINHKNNHSVCHVFGECFDVVGEVDLSIKFNKNKNCKCLNNCNNKIQKDLISLTCTIINSPYDMIIGLPTIIEYKLFKLLENHYKCHHKIPVRQLLVTQPNKTVTQLAAIYMENQSRSGYKRESMKA